MRPVTDVFLAEVRRSHTVVSEVWLHAADGSDPVAVPVTDGSVSLDVTAAVRGRCDIQVEHAEWIPRDVSDGLSPFGAELEIRRGVRFANGSTELVGLGFFGLEDAEVTDEGAGVSVRVAALDRAERVSKAKFEDVFQLAASTPFTEGILEIVRGAWPDVPVQEGFEDVSALSIGKPVTAQAGEDPWEAAQILATAMGMVLFFDGDGFLTLRPYAESGPVVTVSEKDVLLSVSRNWSRSGAFNRVVVTGESTSASTVYRGVATDESPLSPTFYGGPFGRCPEFRQFEQITSDQHAADVAASILAQHLGAPSTVGFGMVPNPALEPEDTITISRPSAGVNRDFIIDSLTVGLGVSEQMTGQTRERISF